MLWITWFDIVWKLKPAFSRWKTFYWAVVTLICFSIRDDNVGITSFVRAHFLSEKYYQRVLDYFGSSAIDLERLTQLWASVCLSIFENFKVTIDGRIILIVDGLKVGKEGRKMPGVKLLHQSSQNNSKAEYIMGHSFQCVSLLVGAFESFFAVPLSSRLHEGYKRSSQDSRTLMDKLMTLLRCLKISTNYYLVADAYYFCGRLAQSLVKNGNHLITKIRINAVAYLPFDDTKTTKGRKKIYGEKVKLINLFKGGNGWVEALSPVYGETDVILKYKVTDLMWKNFLGLARYVLVRHPTRGKMILLSTDIKLDPLKIIELYGRRFKIEVSFKYAIHSIGAYFYHFWMKDMDKNRRGDGDKYLDEMDMDFKKKFLQKIKSYNLHVQMGLIAQGLLQYLAISFSKEIWSSFGSWLRTIRPGIPPSEQVVSIALRNTYMQFLLGKKIDPSFKKFITEKMDFERFGLYRQSG